VTSDWRLEHELGGNNTAHSDETGIFVMGGETAFVWSKGVGGDFHKVAWWDSKSRKSSSLDWTILREQRAAKNSHWRWKHQSKWLRQEAGKCKHLVKF
jgi:hypothetical protein